MKITIVIEDGKVTTSRDEGPSQAQKIGPEAIDRPTQSVHDAGAAPSSATEESRVLAEQEEYDIVSGLGPQYAPAATAVADANDAGAAPSFDGVEEELVEEEYASVEEEEGPTEEEEPG